MKERMSCLEQMQKDLAEFFCEDPNSFKLNECYKSMWEFCLKFKQVRLSYSRISLQEKNQLLSHNFNLISI